MTLFNEDKFIIFLELDYKYSTILFFFKHLKNMLFINIFRTSIKLIFSANLYFSYKNKDKKIKFFLLIFLYN